MLSNLENDPILSVTFRRGGCSMEECRILHEIVRITAPAKVLEVGTFYGTSTVALASALK